MGSLLGQVQVGDGGVGFQPSAYYSWYFDERTYTPNILVLSGGLGSGNYYPYPFFDTRSVEEQYFCYTCTDSAYLTDPSDWSLSFDVYGGCTQGLYQQLLFDNIDFASWLRLQFDNGLLIANSGFGVTPYALGQQGYNDLIAFMDSLVDDPNAVFYLDASNRDMVRRYGYGYMNDPPDQLRYYKRVYVPQPWSGDVTLNIPCGNWSHYVHYDYTRIIVYYLASADGFDADYRWQQYYFPAIYNFIRYGLPSYYPQYFQHPASRVEYGYWGQYLIYKRAYRTVELVLIPSVPFEIEQYLDQCSLCDLINAVGSLVQAYNWDDSSDHWQRVRDTQVFYPNYQSWKDFLANLIQAVRPVYEPCDKPFGSFIATVSIPARYPDDALEQGIGLSGTLIRQAISDGQYIPVFHTRAAWSGKGTEQFVFLNTCSPGMVAFSISTRFASYVLFTIWFAFALRRAIMQAFDLVRGDGGDE